MEQVGAMSAYVNEVVVTQHGPWPTELESLVAQVRYRQGWRFWLTDEERDPAKTHGVAAGGLTLTITTLTANSYHQESCSVCGTTITDYRVRHLFIVPTTTWGRQAWLDWLMDRIEDVERHEAREFFQLERTEIVTPDRPILDSEGHVTGLICGPAEHRSVTEHPFAPNHKPGADPYRRYSYADPEDSRRDFRGALNP